MYNKIKGTNQDDAIIGTSGDDFIMAGAGEDVIEAGDGDDWIVGGAGYDELTGGAGNDTFVFGLKLDADGAIATDVEGDIIHDFQKGEDVVRLENSSGQNAVNYQDVELEQDGDDVIVHLTIVSANGETVFQQFTISNAHADNLTIGDFDSGADIQIEFYNAQLGNSANSGNSNTIDGTDGDDWIDGTDGDDVILAGDGDDGVDAGAGDDYIEGGDGDDYINGGDGNDHIEGDNGDDEIEGGAGDDEIYGGEGDDLLLGDEGHDYIEGGAGDDHIEGGAGHDELDGGEGNDAIFGGEGSDVINGGEGDDYIVGGTGHDVLTGGEGSDTFVFGVEIADDGSIISDIDGDIITDFSSDDSIVLENDSDNGLVGYDDIQLTQDGPNVVITLNIIGPNGDIIPQSFTILDADADDITIGDIGSDSDIQIGGFHPSSLASDDTDGLGGHRGDPSVDTDVIDIDDRIDELDAQKSTADYDAGSLVKSALMSKQAGDAAPQTNFDTGADDYGIDLTDIDIDGLDSLDANVDIA